MAKKDYDFSGWATRNNIKCSDGRTIIKDAFKADNGKRIPLVWNHDHGDVTSVLGHAILENRDEGVYAYCKFNNTYEGTHAKEMVKNGDVSSLSIYANKLKQLNGNVIHGNIRELSLVLAGSNPGAYIESVMIHGEADGEEGRIWNPCETLELYHDDSSEEVKEELTEEKNNETKSNDLEDLKPEPKNINEPEELKMAAEDNKDETVQDVIDSMTDKQKDVMYALIGNALDENNGGTEMKQNAFDQTNTENGEVLSHSDLNQHLINAQKNKVTSLKEEYLAHGIDGIEALFPEVQAVNKTPELITRDMNWVGVVMSNVKKTPFSRVKSTAANITADEARAKGYVKGKQKVEEVISALKRTTTPQTIYKKQKLDRDDILDITDFDVVSWLKIEMRTMLEEELARAILIGDGRSTTDDDKIKTDNIRPILGDNPLYTVPKILTRAADVTDGDFAREFIIQIKKSRKDYKGSGNPTLFTTEDMLTEMLLIEDLNKRVVYETVEVLKTALRVANIVTVPVMENLVRTDDTETYDYTALGILVNLVDYNIGADKGGQTSMFEDFDIDFNQHKYLMETRCSGALIKPYSAISFELRTAHTAG